MVTVVRGGCCDVFSLVKAEAATWPPCYDNVLYISRRTWICVGAIVTPLSVITSIPFVYTQKYLFC